MKKFLMFIVVTLCCCVAPAQNNFRMSGTFADVKNDTLIVEYVKWEPNKEIVNLKVPVANGIFSFGCKIKNAYEASLILKSTKKSHFLIFVPEEEVVINGVFAHTAEWKMDGSAFYKKLSQVMELHKPYAREFDVAMEKYIQGVAAGGDETTLAEQRKKTNMDINRRLDSFTWEYIHQHPDEETTVPFIGMGNFDNFAEEIRVLSPSVRNGRFKNYLDLYQRMIDRFATESKASQKAKKVIQEGKLAPDFTLKDIDGNDFTLSSLFHQGKYVIVDFWGSWCTWCIKGFPKMKEYSAKYKNRLAIVGVDCYDKEDKWKNAVTKNQVNWLQVRSVDGTAEVRFGVKGYPHKVLISPEGKVLKITTGEGDDFYHFLDATLKQ